MRQLWILIAGSSLLSAPCLRASAQQSPPAIEGPVDATAEVVVEGERPGPGIWQVSKGDHDLWILPSLDPLPKKMVWRSQMVEQRIAQSQVVLAPPTIGTNVGFFKGLTLIPSLLRAEKNPDGKTLEQELPHDVYMRWLAMRVKYLGSSDDEKKRPIVAAFDLYEHAIDHAGLTSDPIVWESVEKQAHKAHVAIQPIKVMISLDDPKGSIRELDRISSDAEIACVTKTIDRLESDLQPMVKRANYWALGDMDGLNSLPYPDARETCLNAFLTSPKINEQFNQANAQAFDLWLTTADSALDKNRSTFAVLPISVFLGEKGILKELRAKGYAIKAP